MRTKNPFRRREEGAALVIGLMLLAILTLLAVTGMSTSSTELIMAGNEQFRGNAMIAADSGRELAIKKVPTVSTIKGDKKVVAKTLMPGSTTDSFETTSEYIGDRTGIPGFSTGEFVGHQYMIEITGRSARNAMSQQQQGVYVVGPGAGTMSYP